MAEFLEVAKQAVLEASNIIRSKSGKNEEVLDKISRFDIVTQVDLDSEYKILEIIRASFPGHNILSEEKGLSNIGSEFTWVIDPLDGTALFTAGLPDYCVAIGLLKNNEPYLGVISRVETSETYWAQVGQGAFKNGQRIHVSDVDDLSRAVVFSDYQNTWEQRVQDLNRAELLLKSVKTLRSGTGSVSSLAYLAEGKISGFTHVCKPWDFAAGAIIVMEAGGKISAPNGGLVDWSQQDLELVSTNGLVHEELIEIYN